MKDFGIPLYTVFVLALFIAAAGCTSGIAVPVATIEPADVTRTVTVNDTERLYLLHIPPGIEVGKPVALLLAFHGSEMSAAEMELSTGFNDIADEAGFLVVYPEGMEETWNVGICCGYAAANKIDEAAFVRQIISDLGEVANLDPKRIYAAGFSNGASLVYQLACEMSDVLAGIAPVAGVMVYSPCIPQQPVSVIHIHGLNDVTVPYDGGGVLNTPPVEQVIANWVEIDGCTGTSQTETVHKIINHTAYSSCQAGTAVELYGIDFGIHAWQSITAWPGSQAIWDFFAAHPKP